MSEYKKPVCKGSWVLGSACGHCERCEETKPKFVDDSSRLKAPFRPGKDPLAELRREALLVLGYHPDHRGEISSEPLSAGQDHRLHSQLAEATLGRCLIRYLNARARAN